VRNPQTGAIVGDSPFMNSLIVLIMLVFLAIGAAYGIGAKTITSSVDGINAVTKTFAGLSGLVFLLFVIRQFLAHFNYSNMATIVAVKVGVVNEAVEDGVGISRFGGFRTPARYRIHRSRRAGIRNPCHAS